MRDLLEWTAEKVRKALPGVPVYVGGIGEEEEVGNQRMREAMVMSGALMMKCPYCGEEVPVHPKNKEGGAMSSMCVECGERIQVRGELEPVRFKMMLDGELVSFD